MFCSLTMLDLAVESPESIKAKPKEKGTSVGDESIRVNQFLTYFSSILTGKVGEQSCHNLSLCNVVLAQRSRHCVKHRHQVKNPKRNEEFQKTPCHHCISCTMRLKCIEFSIDGNVHFPFATSNIIKPTKTNLDLNHC